MRNGRMGPTPIWISSVIRVASITWEGILPTNDLQFFNLFLNKKVEKPEDFKKLRIGTATAARALTEGWGAAPVNLQLTDYYTAMERNTVDGVSSSTLSNWVSSGCQAVTKYLVLPGYFQSFRIDHDEPEYLE